MKYNTIPLVFLTTSIGGYFQSYSIVHVRRQVNYVAYDLARDARLFFPLRVWGEVVPPNILNYDVKDLV